MNRQMVGRGVRHQWFAAVSAAVSQFAGRNVCIVIPSVPIQNHFSAIFRVTFASWPRARSLHLVQLKVTLVIVLISIIRHCVTPATSMCMPPCAPFKMVECQRISIFLAEWTPMYTPTAAEVTADRAAAYEAGVPHGEMLANLWLALE